ncbi:MAG: kdpD [Hyphomicrobiales bacterium]|nr:kdpD [Hyphomicrobiales bacterium]
MARRARDPESRPDPDALLALTAREGRGRLKVFLGAAPGVGKTFAMLQGARRLAQDGVDVVIGLVETHGRSETADLLAGLEILPRRPVDHHGRALLEFDLDAALARHPALLVLDELAHSNPAACRHPKRWQDVEELLGAGIDVWTALNIQHLESLADVVARITGVTVRETVPDKVLQQADDVVLVDITPDELIARLHDGKIYIPETARRATQNFFTPANLTALRELALRRTADRVDDQVADFARGQALEGPWGTAERLLVCIGDDARADHLVRYASRLAIGLNATWLAVHMIRPGADGDPARQTQIMNTLRLAERLGAETTQITAQDFAADLIRLARRENATQIVVGQAQASLTRFARRSLADRLIRDSGDIAIHVTPTQGPPPRRTWTPAAWLSRTGLAFDAIAAAASTALAIAFGHLLGVWLTLPNVSMIFLAAVLFCALRRGTRAAVLAAMLSFFGYNFFFIEPRHTFTVAAPHEVFALLVFLVVAILTGSLAGRVRHQAETVARRASATQSLYEFTRKMSAASTADDVLWAAAAHINKTFAARALLLVPDKDDLQLRAAWPPEEHLDAGNRSAAQWALTKGEPAGWRTQTLPNLTMQYRPLRSPRAILGVCGFGPAESTHELGSEDERMLAAILDQTAIALDRALLVDEAIKVAALQENESIRDALLASLSHDLRTPLATITGAVTSLRELGAQMSEEQQRELLQSIEAESARLSRFVANLLDMSRIESGALKVRRDWVDVGDAVRGAVERSRKAFPQNPTNLSIEPGLPFIRGDASLLEQVLFNLLDNAHKYAGDVGAIVHARREDGNVLISVTDEGPGIRPADLERIFEKFYRGGRNDGRRAGTGLGLSICRGIVNSMGGTIEAQSPAIRRRGTRMVIRIPVAEMPANGGVA